MIADLESEGLTADQIREATSDLEDSLATVSTEVDGTRPDDNIINAVSYLEDTFDCSGFCEAPLFYLTKDITNGPPT